MHVELYHCAKELLSLFCKKKNRSKLISPLKLWDAQLAGKLCINAAFKTSSKTAVLRWITFDGRDKEFLQENKFEFEIVPDGNFRKYTIDILHPNYKGLMKCLRIDPTNSSEPNQWVKIKSISFEK